MQAELCECYRILELDPGASRDDVKRAYRELVKVWHPDRFTHDPKLQRKAQEKLKQINLAYERICAVGPTLQATGSRNPAGSETNVRADSTSSPQTAQPQESNRYRRFGQVALTVAIIVIVRVVFTSRDSSQPRNVESRSSYSEPRQIYRAPQLPRMNSQQVEVQTKLISTAETANATQTGVNATTTQPVLTREVTPAYSVPAESRKVESSLESLSEPTRPNLSASAQGFFTVGSTKDEVLAVQGVPSKSTDATFYYHLTRLNNSGSSPFHIYPENEPMLNGTWDAEVHFQNGRVVSWDDKNLDRNSLRAKMLPSRKVDAKDYFTVGSSKDDVLSVQGTPSNFTDRTFRYGSSVVNFENDRVVSWSNFYPKLRVNP